jgi:hypothetical protein
MLNIFNKIKSFFQKRQEEKKRKKEKVREEVNDIIDYLFGSREIDLLDESNMIKPKRNNENAKGID